VHITGQHHYGKNKKEDTKAGTHDQLFLLQNANAALVPAPRPEPSMML
jgi:hypothetical protein